MQTRWTALFLVMLLPAATAQNMLPEQVHTSLAEEGGLMVQYATLEPYPATMEPIVEWRVANGTWQTTPAELAGTASGIESPGSRTHTYAAAVATDGAPGAEVEYRVGARLRAGEMTASMGGLHTIRIPPVDTLTFVAFADIGYAGIGLDGRPSETPLSAPFRVRDLALLQDPDLVLIPGDLAYDNSNQGWDAFMRFMEPLAAGHVFMPVMGNHERQNTLEGYHQYLERMVLPNDEHKFLFRAGPVTFIGLNSDSICARGPERLATGQGDECPQGTGEVDQDTLDWIDAALQEAQGDATPWTVVYFHHQTHSHGQRAMNPAVMQHWVPRFEAAGVDVVLVGHDHFYVRSHPIRDGSATSNGTPTPAGAGGIPGTSAGPGFPVSYAQGGGPIHVVSGGGGRSLYALKDEPLPPHLAHAQAIHHLVRFDADADTLTMTAIEADNGTVIDAFRLHRGALPERTGTEPAREETPALAVLAALMAMGAAVWLRRRTPGPGR